MVLRHEFHESSRSSGVEAQAGRHGTQNCLANSTELLVKTRHVRSEVRKDVLGKPDILLNRIILAPNFVAFLLVLLDCESR